MANSDYTARNLIQGFCPSATLAAAISRLDTAATMTGFTSSVPEGVTLDMAAMIENEIISISGRVGNLLTITRGCCDTIPQPHSTGARIWFFDDSIGTDSIEYGATETIGVKILPRTAVKAVPIAGSPPAGITFNWRFKRPYPPGLVKANAASWFTLQTIDPDVTDLVLSWKHRDRIGQADQLVDHTQDNIGPEPGTTYVVRVYKADNTLIRTVSGLTGLTWTYDRATALTDFGVSSGVHSGYAMLFSVRDALESYQGYRIDFQLDADEPADFPPLSSIPIYYKFNGTNNQTTGILNSGSLGGTTNATSGHSLRTAAPKYGSASLRYSPVGGSPQWIAKFGTPLFVPVNGKGTIGGWVKKNGTYGGTLNTSLRADITWFYYLELFEPGARYVSATIDMTSIEPTGSLNLHGSGMASSLHALTDGVFVHWEIDFDGTACYFFVNGALVATRTTLNDQPSSGGYGTLYFNSFTSSGVGDGSRWVEWDDVYVIPGSCLHTASFTPPAGEFT